MSPESLLSLLKTEIVIDEHGTEYYYINGKLHREDGPAIIYANGGKQWYTNGKLHREDGPAIIYNNGHKEWWINGHRVSESGTALHRLDHITLKFKY